MNYEQIKKRLAPCGLHCGNCFAFKNGEIGEYSRKLRIVLGEFDVYAKRFVDLLDKPVFLKYPEFKDLLDYFSQPECSGCREERCKLFKGCNVRDCSEKMRVDFCFECPEFPCNNTGFDEHLHDRSVKINKLLKETGIEEYYNEIKDKPRY